MLRFLAGERTSWWKTQSAVLTVIGLCAAVLSILYIAYGFSVQIGHINFNGLWHMGEIVFVIDWVLILLLALNLYESRKKTRQAMQNAGESREHQYFLDSMIEHIPNMIFLKDAKELKFVRLNRAGESLLGYSRNDLIGKSDYDFFPKEQADFFTEKDRDVLKGRDVVDIPDEPIKTAKGTRYLHTKKIPIFDSLGAPLYLLGISEDITEKKASEQQKISLMKEQAARAEMERNVRYLTFLSKASLVMSESLDIETMLKSVATYVASHMADMCMIDLINEHGDGIQRLAIFFRHPNKQGRAEEFRGKFSWDDSHQRSLTVLHSGKSEIYPEMNDEFIKRVVGREEQFRAIKELGMQSGMSVPIKYYRKMMGAITLFSAESGHRYDEFDLSVVEDLAKRIATSIENARLYAKAQSASRAKSEFLANMSHEIRTPLSAMLGFSEVMLTDPSLTMENREYTTIIARNGRQLVQIVDEILDLAKIESDTMKVENTSFQPRQLIDEVAMILKTEAEKKDLQFHLRYASELPPIVSTDPTRFRQILINVIGNAVKFTEKGSIDVTVQLKNSKSAAYKKNLQIEIKDTGIGISGEHRKKLFQPFVQADSSTKRLYGGTGLGLFLSKKLARLLGGDLLLTESGLHKGSTFVLTTEVDVPEIEKPMGPAARKINEPQKELQETEKRGRVLIVDDVADNRKLIGYHVTHLGFEIDQADTGQKGIEKALNNYYDLILMDVQMPELDGFEAVRRLRNQNYQRPVIALTAYAMKGDKERCLKAGFDDYLVKPLETELLKKILLKYARKKHERPNEPEANL